MTEDKLYQVALSLIPKIGPVLSKQLINYFGSPKTVLATPKAKLTKIPGVGEKLASLIPRQKDLLAEAERVINESFKEDITVHYYKEASYPKRLLAVPDSPVVLYSKGKVELNPLKTIGIVGARKATNYGMQATDNIVKAAKTQGASIISGLAFGIDVRSHQAAVNQGLPTIGVLARGLEDVYPKAHRKIARQMLDNGGLISEYPIGTGPDPRLFPARNRIIAAMSDALIVAEAAIKGGALISANIAHGYDRPVFAVPGELGKPYSEGCNWLIKSLRANIYTGFNEVVQELGWDNEEDTQQRNNNQRYQALEGAEKKVVDTLMKNGQQMHLDQLSWQSEIPLNQLAGVLLQLEFAGLVKPLPGKEYLLT
ncbi:MAG: DNA-processing protein DprA [Roseivirga sp.]